MLYVTGEFGPGPLNPTYLAEFGCGDKMKRDLSHLELLEERQNINLRNIRKLLKAWLLFQALGQKEEVFLVNQLHNLPGHYGNGKGIHPNWVEHSSDMKKFQVHPEKIKHNAVAAASPLAPLGAIEQRINSPSLKGSQTGDKNFISSLCSQDVLTGWPVTGKT
ncbi:uncharacterized protein C4orf51 homolog isoform 2-T2 [Liasis olivaceus]